MVDGVVLLVDASEGPLPQTRFVLRKALQASLPVILVVNKTDRPDARIDGVVSDTMDLLLGLASDVAEENPELDVDAVLDLPIVYASGKAGRAAKTQPEDGGLPENEDLEPLFETILQHVPAPTYDDAEVLQAHVTNLDASPSWVASHCCVSSTAPCARTSKSRGRARTAPSRPSRSQNCWPPRGSSVFLPNPPAPVTSSPSQVSGTS